MKAGRPPKAIQLVYAGSLALHVAGGAAIAAVEIRRPEEPVVIEVTTVERPKPEPEPPKPTPEPEPPKPAPRAAPAPAPVAAPAPAAAPDFGLSLGNIGPSSGPGGIAIPVPAAAPKPVVRTAARELQAAVPTPAPTCTEEDTKARAQSMPHPAYTEEARAAAIEGKVRIELALDASGAIVSATVLEGLGYGLDEAALEAVRGATFTPATHCGKAVGTTFTVAIRFAL